VVVISGGRALLRAFKKTGEQYFETHKLKALEKSTTVEPEQRGEKRSHGT